MYYRVLIRIVSRTRCSRVKLEICVMNSVFSLLNAAKIHRTHWKLSRNLKSLNKMEGYITTAKGTTDLIVSSGQSCPIRKTNFVGITPEKQLTNVSTPSDRPFKVSVEGNIGAGKSTLLQYFSTFPGIEIYTEPIEWWRNLEGHNLLQLLYTDMKQWQHVFQTYVQLTRLKVQTSKPNSPFTTVQMFERSLQNNRFCFLEVAHQNGLHEAEYSVLDKWFRWMRENTDISLDLTVYLRSSPERVYERILKRGRPEETGITLEYLKQLHENHERWLMSDDERFNTIPVLVLDADKTLDEIHTQYKLNQDRILGIDKRKSKHTADSEELNKVKRNLILDET